MLFDIASPTLEINPMFSQSQWYTTGQVAKICRHKGRKGVRLIAKLFDEGIIPGALYTEPHWRKSIRLIPFDSLVSYMKEKRIPLDRLDKIIPYECKFPPVVRKRPRKTKKVFSPVFGWLSVTIACDGEKKKVG